MLFLLVKELISKILNFWSFDFMKNENSLKTNIKQREETFRELLPKAAAVFAAATGF